MFDKTDVELGHPSYQAACGMKIRPVGHGVLMPLF
jgi:hypothetical protein